MLAVLAGTSRDDVAAELGIPTTDLDDAIGTYQQAGHAALESQAVIRDWYSVHVQFPKWDATENTAATTLGPALQLLQDSGLIAKWWFMRKAPCWRLRLKPGYDATLTDVRITANAILDRLMADGLISRWRRTLYEPEAVAFGGRMAMDVAHDLFCVDSSNILAYLCRSEPTFGRRELSVLLCTSLLRAAGQEWFECGDIWHRVTQMRPLPADTPFDRLTKLADNVRTLLTYDARPTSGLFGSDGPLAFAARWVTGFHQAGQELAAAATQGALEHGIRDILRYHVIFHWNRIGLPSKTQSILAHATKTAIFSGPPSGQGRRTGLVAWPAPP